MMSDANREIRLMEYQALERRRQLTPQRLMRVLDELIEELEEMNLDEVREIPESFSGQLDEVCALLPGPPPRRWPTSVTSALDYCFDLQDQLRLQREPLEPHELH